MSVLDETRPVWGYADSEDSEEWTAAKDRDDAIDHAYEIAFDQGSPAAICEGAWVSPAKCAALALGEGGEFLLRMNEIALDNEVCSDDDIFEAGDDALNELERLVEEWATKHVSVSRWMCNGPTIQVDVCRAVIPEDQKTPTNWTDENGGPYCCEPLVGVGATCPKHPEPRS